jgi:hypothetical protein
MSDEQKEADGCAVRFSNALVQRCWLPWVRALPFAIEKVVGRVRDKRLIADIV